MDGQAIFEFIRPHEPTKTRDKLPVDPRG